MNNNNDSLFFCDIDISDDTIREFNNKAKKFSEENQYQVYLLKNILGSKKKYKYNIENIFYMLIPKYPIILIDFGNSSRNELEEYLDEFKYDLGYLSDKYEYDKILGRPRKWNKNLIQYCNIEEFDFEKFKQESFNDENIRNIDLLISLIICSINNVEKITEEEPNNILDKIKQKIILFDAKQSSFIHQNETNKCIKIQGMAGTGKTELLLHKLKDLYSKESNSKIAFTCHNKALANDMKKRIPKFFDFMKVEEQIDWENRLYVFNAWGSKLDYKSGIYSYICNNYNLQFLTYGQEKSFDKICKLALDKLNTIEEIIPCFDYVFIDESQDFEDSFFNLCEKVTKNNVYIAGDIFQNIFDSYKNNSIKPDFLLNKCYRTDPKTFMFAHAISMGLYEEPKLNWLDDLSWKACGYEYKRENGKLFELTRKPLRRFEDLGEEQQSKIIESKYEDLSDTTIRIIKELKEKYNTIKPDDIGIVIIGGNRIYDIANKLSIDLINELNWESCKGHESKFKDDNKVYISNVNNIKGLEFPFLICVIENEISNNINYRNSIYMSLTRSLVTSYLIVNDVNKNLISLYKKALYDIYKNEKIELTEPSATEKEEIKNKIKISQSKALLSIKDIEDTIKEYYSKKGMDVNVNGNEIEGTALLIKRATSNEKLTKEIIFKKLDKILGEADK